MCMHMARGVVEPSLTLTYHNRKFTTFLILCLVRVREGEESLEVNPMTVFHSAMANTRPIIGTTNVTRGGKHYHVRHT